MLILASSAPHKMQLVRLSALVITGSIVAHSSTDVLVARWFRRQPEPGPQPAGSGQNYP
jgi:hypothetical protein